MLLYRNRQTPLCDSPNTGQSPLTQPNKPMKNYDAWKTFNPACEVEDTFCPDCDASAEVIEDADEDGPCSSLHCASCEAREKKGSISLDLLQEIELDGLDMRDAPDFVDAFIKSAKWVNHPKGVPPELTEEQLDRVPQEAVYELLQKRLH